MWNKKYIIVSVLISIGAIVLLLTHWFVPKIKIDLTTLTLFIILIMPWLLPFIKSVEIPNLFKIETKDIKEAIEKIKKVKDVVVQAPTLRLSATLNPVDIITEIKNPILSLKIIGEKKPELALVGFRIEIEKRISALAELVYGEEKRQPLGRIVKKLIQEKIIQQSTASGLLDLIALGNRAAHGTKVSKEAANFVIEEGPFIIERLDTIINQIKENKET